MIEVEKKFTLNKKNERKLLEGATSLGEKMFTDVYWDTSDFALTRTDRWLRQRDNRWELKLPLNDALAERVSDQYREIEDERGVAGALKLCLGNSGISGALTESGYSPFATIITTRRKYTKGDFTIDLDTMDFGYELAEIELMVPDEEQASAATEKVLVFATEYGLEQNYVRGKVVEFLKRNNAVHFQALQDAGIVP